MGYLFKYSDLGKWRSESGPIRKTEEIRSNFGSELYVAEILNLQPRNSLAKPYQAKQVRKVLVQHKLAEGVE